VPTARVMIRDLTGVQNTLDFTEMAAAVPKKEPASVPAIVIRMPEEAAVKK
jgi:hypothetical protein